MARKSKKASNRLNNQEALRQRAEESGWSIGAKFLDVPIKVAYQKVKDAGLKVWMDNEELCIYGIASEAVDAMLIALPEVQYSPA